MMITMLVLAKTMATLINFVKVFFKLIPGYQDDKMNLSRHSNKYFLFLISKSLRKENPIKTYHDLSASEEQEITDDLQVFIFMHSLHVVFLLVLIMK